MARPGLEPGTPRFSGSSRIWGIPRKVLQISVFAVIGCRSDGPGFRSAPCGFGTPRMRRSPNGPARLSNGYASSARRSWARTIAPAVASHATRNAERARCFTQNPLQRFCDARVPDAVRVSVGIGHRSVPEPIGRLSSPKAWAQSLNGANSRVAPRVGAGWEDRRCGLLVPVPRVPGPARGARPQWPWPRRQGHRAAGSAPRARFCAGRSRLQGFAPWIVPCSRRRPATCHAPRAPRVWSARGCCCAGIGRSYAASGGSRPATADARLRRPRCGPWCCGWLARIRVGAIVGSAVSWPNAASGCRHRRSVGCSTVRDLGRLRGGRVRVGGSSCAPRRRASLPATSSRRERPLAPILRVLLHRTRKPPCPVRRLLAEPHRSVGHPAGARPRPRWRMMACAS
jgi:hypothetical protein